MTPKVRAIAFHLPQFHPIAENNEWWGEGFTEWTNTAKAKPLYKGHYQPHVPADLGFYDLRLPQSRAAQAKMASEAGIEGFCYYHYWFAGRRILEGPVNDIITLGEPNFPFCLCWANQTWTGIWHGAPNRILIEQTYPGPEDHRAHFQAVLPALRDPRAIRVDGRPVFVVFAPIELPDAAETIALWRSLAAEAGLPGIYFVANTTPTNYRAEAFGFDAAILGPPLKDKPWISRRQPLRWLKRRLDVLRGRTFVQSYDVVGDTQMASLEQSLARDTDTFVTFPCLVHAWDNSPRSGAKGIVIENATPEKFRRYFSRAVKMLSHRPTENRIVFLKSWNEWAEGNHLEPDLRDGHAYLNVVRDSVQ